MSKFGEEYYFVADDGSICTGCWCGCSADKFRLSKRNFYQIKEQCQFALDMYKFCKERSFDPDWNDCEQDKWKIYLGNDTGLAKIMSFNYHDHFSPFYYPTREAAQEVIDKYSFEELEEYYGRV